MSSQRCRSESLRGRECDGHRQVQAARRLLTDNMPPLGQGLVWKTGERYRSHVLLQCTVCDLIQIQPEQVVWMCTQAALDISFRGDKPEKPKTFQLDRLSLFKRPEIAATHFLRRYFDLGEHRGGIDNDCSSNLNNNSGCKIMPQKKTKKRCNITCCCTTDDSESAGEATRALSPSKR